jgi:hypothetical protein
LSGDGTKIFSPSKNQNLMLKYRVFTMKCPDFGEFLKIGKWFFFRS